MIHFAYDGSLNGDWVSRYAIRLAAASGGGVLRVVHVPDGSIGRAELAAKLTRMEQEATARGVGLDVEIAGPARDVGHALDALLPAGPEHMAVCGTRVRPRRRRFLAGTLSERLLGQHRLPVAAIRVVQPGLLGNPRSFLIPLSGNRAGIATAWPFFRLFLHDAETVSLLRVMRAPSIRLPGRPSRAERARREEGWALLHEVMAALPKHLERQDFHMDGRVVLSNDWPREIAVQANALHARLILLGASGHTLLRRRLGDPLEQILRATPCDVAICRSA
jgi:nucleotide-binding universal stress UspA family protein